MLYINVLALMALFFMLGFLAGKGRIEIAKKLTDKEKEQIEKMDREQQQAIDNFNSTIKEMQKWGGGEQW